MIPSNWSKTVLSEVAEHALGKMLDRAKHTEGVRLRYLRNINVQWERIDADNVFEMFFRADQIDRFSLQAGDLLVCEGGEPGRCAIWDGHVPRMMYQKALHRVRVGEALDSRYLLHSLRHDASTDALATYFTGTTIKHFTARALATYELSLPPLNEQRRIVSKLDACFVHTKKAKEALDRIPSLLEKFRQSVLAAAFRGDLTKEWRKNNPDVEPAETLLARIRVERRQKWEEEYLKKQRAKGKEPKNDKWKTKYKEPEPVDTEGLPELPKGWCWARVNEAGKVQLGRQRSPKHHSGEHMRPYLRVANVFEDRIDTKSVLRMNFTPAEFERYRLSAGDVLLNEGQSAHLIGRPAIYRDEVEGACFQNTLVRFRANREVVRSEFALLVFRHYLWSGRFQRIGKITTNISHLGAGRFSELEFPVPPIAEQDAVVCAADTLLKLEALLARQTKGLRVKVLESALLAKAFRGELVPQDPSDEPASVLLERIRAERELAEAAKAKPKKKRARKKTRQP